MPEVVLQDIRFALRKLSKSKGFTITAVATLALGIGANTAIFTLVNAVLFRSLPVTDPQRLVRLGDQGNCCVIGGYQSHFSIFSYPLYLHLRDHTPEFEEMAAFQAGFEKVGVRRINGGEGSEPFVDQFVSGNYFKMFGLKPFAGRLLSPADDVRGAPAVAVMSYRVWQQHYGGDFSVVGASFLIEGSPYTIAGIAPPGFFGDTLRPDPPDFWMPLATEPAAQQQNSLLDKSDQHWLYVMGRSKPGFSQPRVESELNVELRQWLLANEPPTNAENRRRLEQVHLTLSPGGGGVALMKENYEQDLRLLLGITGLVLLIACANLANLQLARGAANAAQISTRVALGAPRHRLVRQMLTESLLLAVGGGALALLVAFEMADLLVKFVFPKMFVPLDAAPSLPVLAFTFVLSLATGTVFGAAPAWAASRTDPLSVLQGAGRTIRHTSIGQKSLVVAQATLSLILLAGAGLMVRTLSNLQNQQFGFEMEGSAVARIHAGLSGYSPEKLATTYREFERRIRQVPGVQDTGFVLYSPMSGNNWQTGATLEDQPGRVVSPVWNRVSPTFFRTIGAHILRGRGFDDRDTPAATHVAVVNQVFAEQYYPGKDPLGKRFGLGGPSHAADYQIVGVVNNIVFRNARQVTPPPMFFLPLLQMSPEEWKDTGKARSNMIGAAMLRVSRHPAGLAEQIQRAAAAVDPNLTVLGIDTSAEQLENELGHERLIARLAEVFGGLALLLASIGLYGITAYSVARRTSEIGVRSALGANRPQIVRLVLSGALGQIAIGVLLGVPAAIGVGKVLAGQLYGVKPWDPVTLVGATVVLALCAAAAGLLPAWRASGIDPVQALRVDR